MNPFNTISRLLRAKKERNIEFFPPLWYAGLKIIESSNDWRHVRILLPLKFTTRNMGGSMFGGTQAAVADPIPAIACIKIFKNYHVWTRDLHLDFIRMGNSDLELHFDFDPDLEQKTREELEKYGKSDPKFKFCYYRKDGLVSTQITNTVAIRPEGFRPPNI